MTRNAARAGAASPPAARGHDVCAHYVPRGNRRRADPGRHRAVPGVQPRAQRADPGADRRQLGTGSQRVRAGVAVPGVHRRNARGHGDRHDHLLLAGLAAHYQGLLRLGRARDPPGARHQSLGAAGHRPEDGLDDHPGDHSCRHRRAGARARLPGVLQQADTHGAVPRAERRHPAGRRAGAQAADRAGRAAVRGGQGSGRQRDGDGGKAGRRAARRRAASHEGAAGQPRGAGRPAADPVGLAFRVRPRRGADLRAAAGHQQGRHRDGVRDVPRAVQAGRRPVLVPALRPGDPGGGGARRYRT